MRILEIFFLGSRASRPAVCLRPTLCKIGMALFLCHALTAPGLRA